MANEDFKDLAKRAVPDNVKAFNIAKNPYGYKRGIACMVYNFLIKSLKVVVLIMKKENKKKKKKKRKQLD